MLIKKTVSTKKWLLTVFFYVKSIFCLFFTGDLMVNRRNNVIIVQYFTCGNIN